MKKILLTLLVITILLLSSCQNKEVLNEVDTLEKQLINLRNENEQLKENIENLVQKNKKSEQKIGVLMTESDESKQAIEKLTKENEDLRKKSTLLQPDEVVVNKKPAYKYIIDGIQLRFIDKEKFFLEYDQQTYISSDFLKSYYNVEQHVPYALLINGLPAEEKIIKTDGILELNYDGLKEQLKTAKTKEQDEGIIIYTLDGFEITLRYGRFEYYVLTKPLYATSRGITIGSTRSEVQKAYGRLGKEDAEMWATINGGAEYGGTVFYFKDDNVVKIVNYWP